MRAQHGYYMDPRTSVVGLVFGLVLGALLGCGIDSGWPEDKFTSEKWKTLDEARKVSRVYLRAD